VKRTFRTKNSRGYEESRFSISVTITNGVNYTHISGVEPDWRDVVWAITNIMSRMNIPLSSDEDIFKKEYKIRPDNKIDIRYIPIVECDETQECIKLPLTIDGIYIMEDSFDIHIYAAIKALLALTMAYADGKIKTDRKRMTKLINSRRERTFVEMLNVR